MHVIRPQRFEKISNNYNISGYLFTKSGKILLFSFMNNNYIGKTAPIRNEIERILIDIYLYY